MKIRLLLWSVVLFLLSSCGIASYPGQPGVVTNGYSKIELENLDPEGLWVYEVVYDNRAGGKGVGAIVTKCYAGAHTYTSNVRTNADGTNYITKGSYEGAEVQMIVIPSLNQIHMNPNSKVQFMLEYKTSLNEVDDKNIAEKSIFNPTAMLSWSERGFRARQFWFDALKAARLTPGGLAYEITALELDKQKFTPSKPITLETNLFQSAVRMNLSAEGKAEAQEFLEARFPKGFNGTVSLHVKDAAKPLQVALGIHTIKTAEASGMKIIKDASQALANDIAARFARQ